jgi:aspartyl-tRNA(Asn)/glutamyl-tRNA(Gln) amidotransferase subunit C
LLEGHVPEPITEQIFDHLVQLAALELEPEEARYLRRELNNQLRVIRELEAIEAAGEVPITSHGVPYTPGMSAPPRPDVARTSEEADDILAQAPESEGRYIVVPDIPHTDLE